VEATSRALTLPGIADKLGERLAQASSAGLGHAELLALLVGDEQGRRDSAEPTPRTHVIVLVQDLDIRVVNATTAELPRELALNPDRDYQPQQPKSP
jgi:hypothetical protein